MANELEILVRSVILETMPPLLKEEIGGVI